MNNVKNAFYNTLKTISTVLFPLITIPYISRILTSENIGKVNFANSITSYFTLLASLGVSTYAMRECSKIKEDRNQLEKVSSEIFSINIITMILSYTGLIFLVLCSSKVGQYRTLIFILSINIVGGIIGTEWLNMAIGDFKYIAIRTMGFQFISLILMFLFVREPSDYFIYAIILVISNSGAQIINIFYRRKYCRIKFIFDLNFSRHFKPIILLFSLLLAQTIQSNIDITVLGLTRTDSEVGMYSMSVKLYTTVEKIISSIAYVLIPEISNLYAKRNFNQISKLLSTTLNIITIFSFPMTLGLALLSNEILTVICGSEYAPAATSLSLLAIAMFVNLYGGSFFGNLILLPERREAQFMIACCSSAVFNLIANCFLIPIWGMNGAAFTTVVSMIIVLAVCAAKYDKNINIRINKEHVLTVLFGGVCITLVCLFFKYSFTNKTMILLFSVSISCIVYFTVLFLFKNETLELVLERLKNNTKRG